MAGVVLAEVGMAGVGMAEVEVGMAEVVANLVSEYLANNKFVS